jgi:hypothetical protein
MIYSIQISSICFTQFEDDYTVINVVTISYLTFVDVDNRLSIELHIHIKRRYLIQMQCNYN